MERFNHWFASLVAALVLCFAAAPLAWAQFPDDENPPPEFASRTSQDGVEYLYWEGEVGSFDGQLFDVGISRPLNASGPLPTILVLHGWAEWRGNGLETNRADARNANSGELMVPKFQWNRTWFVSRGYAVVAFTARGFRTSGGLIANTPSTEDDADQSIEDTAEPRSWTHVADRDWEIRDAQHLLSMAVEWGIADPERLAVTGLSYGGGQCWLLATAEPWVTPNSGVTLQLAAAVPIISWTDAHHSLVPNGRATDRLDQSASHERPYGVFKLSFVDNMVGFGATGFAKYNTVDPAELHSFIPGWLAFWNAGEPYDTPQGAELASVFRNKSAYYADAYFDGLQRGTAKAVPVFVVQAGQTTCFPPSRLCRCIVA